MKERRRRSERNKNSQIYRGLADKVTMAVAIDPRTEACVGLKMSPGLPHYAQRGRFPEDFPLLLLLISKI
jgi:hypothetical protein